MTASVTGSPRYASASAFSFCRIIALISGGAYSLPPAFTRASPFWPFTTSYGTIVISSVTSSHLRPMKRLIEKMVFWGFVTCCRRAGTPTRRWSSLNATTDGVVRPPSAFGMTVGSPPSRTAMHEFVVPRSMPIVFAMRGSSKRFVTSGRIKSKPAHVKVSRGRAGLRLARAAARRLVGPRHREPAGVGHGQVQLPLHVLHAGRGPRMAAEAGGAELRGDRTARARARAHGRARGAADGRRAARPARPPRARADARRRARRGRPLADDERRPARPARGAARRGRAEADQRRSRLAQPRPLHRADTTRCARPGPARARGGGALSGAAADQGQLRRAQGLHRGGGPRARRARAPQALRRALHRVHAARRRRGVARGPRPDRRRDPRADRGALAARRDPRAAFLDGAPLPLRRRGGRDRLRQPRLGAVLLGLRPHPPHRRRPAPD